jgi:hypothetical protein
VNGAKVVWHAEDVARASRPRARDRGPGRGAVGGLDRLNSPAKVKPLR